MFFLGFDLLLEEVLGYFAIAELISMIIFLCLQLKFPSMVLSNLLRMFCSAPLYLFLLLFKLFACFCELVGEAFDLLLLPF